MKGFRTIIFNGLMTAIGLLGFKISPATADSWMDVFVAVWGIGAILLRQLTTTPIGEAVSPEIAQVIGHIKLLSAQLAQGLTKDDIASLQADLQTLAMHAASDKALAGHTGDLAAAVSEMIPFLGALVTPAPAANGGVQTLTSTDVPAAALAAEQTLSPAALVPVATPVAEAAVSALAGDGPVFPSPAAPAQPSPVADLAAAFDLTAPRAPGTAAPSIIPVF